MSPNGSTATAPAYENGNGRDLANSKLSLKAVGAILLALGTIAGSYTAVKVALAVDETKIEMMQQQINSMDKKLDHIEDWITKKP